MIISDDDDWVGNMQHPKPQFMVDPTEFAALFVLVRALLATTLNQVERGAEGPGTDLLNSISSACQEAISTADPITDVDLDSTFITEFRSKAMEHVNYVLRSSFPPTKDPRTRTN